MIRPLLRLAVSSLIALCILLAGLWSAAEMAPDHRAQALLAIAATYGPGDAALCGEEGGAEHRCPLCNERPDSPAVTPEGLAAAFRPHVLWRLLDDLHRAAQARDAGHAPRAPPTV
jgi:hypothetical protein